VLVLVVVLGKLSTPFKSWMFEMSAKGAAIHRTRRCHVVEAPAGPTFNDLKPGSPGEEMSHEAHLRKTGGRQSRRNEADTQTRSS
jgi:hypothetical protein